MYIAIYVTDNVKPSVKEIADIDVSAISDDLFLIIIDRVNEVYKELGGTDQVAKSKEFTAALVARWKQEHS